ncbi:MAG TPA: hypothetical protein VLZ83_01190 [Edaphocola sp.]|nr:hypothetical protein [Edaphocola sp.]
MKTTTILRKVLGLITVLILTINYSCTKRDDDDNQDGHFTYIGTIDPFCGYLILLEDEDDFLYGIEFVKPINLDSTFKQGGMKVKVTFSYIGEQYMTCGGFVGFPEKIEIIKIKKL